MKLEELTPDTVVQGVVPGINVHVVRVDWHGSDTVTLSYRTPDGRMDAQILMRDDEIRLAIVEAGRPWAFDGDGNHYRLVAEANRIRLAHLFDPHLAVHSSLVDPLPHQITAVYEEMLPRQPLRFLLADDPGAGKTIMAGLLIKELIARGDLKRCLIVCPGSLVEQWQDELEAKFQLRFDILTNDKLGASRGNWFADTDLAIARLDKLARNEETQLLLFRDECRYDLIVCDEAHKMSASYFGGETRYTKRYHLAERLSAHTRHFLLMTATPHNGKEADFQLFLQLLDGDRFEGKFRDGVHMVDTGDLMRRMVKENLLKFDGKPLFPERIARTLGYSLSPGELRLYQEVTDYVRNEFDRAKKLENDKRTGTVGFALTVLQRRLASSPAALLHSLRRRRERLERKLRELELAKRAAVETRFPSLGTVEIDDIEDGPDDEREAIENEVLDEATAAATIDELRAEIFLLKHLETIAEEVHRSGEDSKWRSLATLLEELFTPNAIAKRVSDGSEPYADFPKPQPSPNQKLVLFTEHRDTLTYLAEKIGDLFGRPEAVRTVHGGMGREERRNAQNQFLHDPAVQILIATDAAGEGFNLQRAHLMVNYDLPWNPNRLEQRFGRIHRIGQTEVCHLWNLVAAETREGDVYQRLLAKLEEARKALGGQVFDVLGQIDFDGRPLRDLLLEAILYGERPDVKARLDTEVEAGVDIEHLRGLIDSKALVREIMDHRRVATVRAEMERAQQRRLQPHYIESFFLEAFRHYGGRAALREPGRYEISHVPQRIRARDRQIGVGDAVQLRYERVAFDRDQVAPTGKPLAAFLCPGHPLLGALIDLILEDYGDLLRRGTILVDDTDHGTEPRILTTLEHAVRDSTLLPSGDPRTISRRLLFVEQTASGQMRTLRYAPYLDYHPLDAAAGDPEPDAILADPACAALTRDVERRALDQAIAELVPAHTSEIRQIRRESIARIRQAVHDRLTKEINYWDRRAAELELQESTGKLRGKIGSQEARKTADSLQGRLRQREEQLDREERITSAAPVVVGAVLVVPRGLVDRLAGRATPQPEPTVDRMAAAARARELVMAIERRFGFEPVDREAERVGYDIESIDPATGAMRFLEVKGRVAGADVVTVTRNEILTSRNEPGKFILALVAFSEHGEEVRYLRNAFRTEPDFGVTSVNYDFADLWARAGAPS